MKSMPLKLKLYMPDLMVYSHFMGGQVKRSWYKAWAKAERILDPSVLSPYIAIIVL